MKPWGVVLLLLLCIAGCVGSSPIPIESPPPVETPSPHPPIQPSATNPIPFMMLLADDPAEKFVLDLSAWAERKHFEFHLLSTQDPDWQALLSQEGLMALVSVDTGEGPTIESLLALDIPWVAVNEPGVSRTASVSALTSSHTSEDQVGFLAGLATGLATRNGRVGWLLDPDQVNSDLVDEGFMRGLRYICTSCRLTLFEVGSFSLTSLRVNADDVLYVPLEDMSEETLSILRDSELPVTIIDQPAWAEEGIEILMEVTLDPLTPVVYELDEQLLMKEGRNPRLSIENGGIRVERMNERYLTEGRMNILSEVLVQLESGELKTGLEGDSD